MYPTKKLSEICEIIGGGTPSKSNPQYYNGDILWASVRDMKDVFLEDTELRISEEAVKKSSTHIIPAGNVIIATRVGLGKVCLNRFPTAINQDLKGILPRDINDIAIDYLFWWFKSISRKLESAGTGATVKGVKVVFIESLQIPLPILSTQFRIVAKLDDAFGNIDKQIELLKENIEDVENMRKSVLEMSFQQEGVQSKVMKDVFTACEYGSSTKSTEDESGVPVLRMGNIQNGGVRYDNLKYTPKESDDLPKLYLKKFDLLFNRTNSWELVGKTGIFLGEDDTISFAGYLIRLRFSSDILPQYANYYFNSEYFRKTQIEPQIDQQCGQANFSGGKLKETKFLYYPLPRQHEIVAHLDTVFYKTRFLRSEYEDQIRDLGILKQSLLEEAFAGRLVTE